jgi:hypothetical protein
LHSGLHITGNQFTVSQEGRSAPADPSEYISVTSDCIDDFQKRTRDNR